MPTPNRFAEISALAGDPTRAAMLHALIDGRALTASELAKISGVTPQTASGHLARLLEAGLLAVEKQGRHRYHRLGSPSVARMLESVMQVASELAAPAAKLTVGPRDQALRTGRTCYDHLAGRLGVAIADALIEKGWVELGSDGGLVSAQGIRGLETLGLDMESLAAGPPSRSRRVLCRPCLDWSERRPHIAGRLGSALCTHAFQSGWIRRVEGTRAVSITPKGVRQLKDRLDVTLM